MVDDKSRDQNLTEDHGVIMINELATLLQVEIKLKKRFFSDAISGGHSWDVLLQLLTATSDKHESSVTAMATLGGMQATTGLRWIDVLRNEGLVIVANDVHGSRKKFVFLTDRGRSGMESYLGAVAGLRQLNLAS